MNKKFFIVTLLIIASLFLFGCQQAEPEPVLEPEPAPEPEVVEEVVEEPEETEESEETPVAVDSSAVNEGDSGIVCGNGYDNECPIGEYCFKEVCRSRADVGGDCISNGDCIQGLFCFTDKKCSDKRITGSDCRFDLDCKSNNCVDKVCAN